MKLDISISFSVFIVEDDDITSEERSKISISEVFKEDKDREENLVREDKDREEDLVRLIKLFFD